MLFAILLAALGIAQAQMSFPDITQAAAAIDRVFSTIDRKTQIDSGSDAGEHLIDPTDRAAGYSELTSRCLGSGQLSALRAMCLC